MGAKSDDRKAGAWIANERIFASMTFKELTQQGSVQCYWYQFQTCLRKIGELPEKHVLSYFVEGLQDDIKKAVRARRPRNLLEALGVARWKEFSLQGFRYLEQDAAIKELGDLRQLGPVQDYQEKFEEVLSKVGTLLVEFTIIIFLDGLKEELHEYAWKQHPQSLVHAQVLAKEQEAYLKLWTDLEEELVAIEELQETGAEAVSQTTPNVLPDVFKAAGDMNIKREAVERRDLNMQEHKPVKFGQPADVVKKQSIEVERSNSVWEEVTSFTEKEGSEDTLMQLGKVQEAEEVANDETNRSKVVCTPARQLWFWVAEAKLLAEEEGLTTVIHLCSSSVSKMTLCMFEESYWRAHFLIGYIIPRHSTIQRSGQG